MSKALPVDLNKCFLRGGKQPRNLADEMKSEFKKALKDFSKVKNKEEVIDHIKKYLPEHPQAAAVLKLISANWTNSDFKTNLANALTNYLNQHQTTQRAGIKFVPEDINSIFDIQSSSVNGRQVSNLRQLNAPVCAEVLRDVQDDFSKAKPFIGQDFIVLQTKSSGVKHCTTSFLGKLKNVSETEIEFSCLNDAAQEESRAITKGKYPFKTEFYPFPLNPNHKTELVNKLLESQFIRGFDLTRDCEYINGSCSSGTLDPRATYKAFCLVNNSSASVGEWWINDKPITNLSEKVINKIHYSPVYEGREGHINLRNRHFIFVRLD